jgi:hypothetical protein
MINIKSIRLQEQLRQHIQQRTKKWNQVQEETGEHL